MPTPASDRDGWCGRAPEPARASGSSDGSVGWCDENGAVGGLWLVVGVQASGKTTVAEGLAREFDRGVHVRGGQFYRWAVRGWVHHDDPRTAEARRHLDLRYRLSGLTADEYCAEGFTTIVQDNLYGPDVLRWLEAVRSRPRHLVVLRPSLPVVAERDEARRTTVGKVAYRSGAETIEGLDALLDATPRIGLWLDTSSQQPDETVHEILDRRDEALVEGAIAGEATNPEAPSR